MGKPHQEIFDDTKAMEELKLDKEDLEGLGGSAPLTSKQGVETKDPQACKGWEIKSRTQAAEVAAELVKERKKHTETIRGSLINSKWTVNEKREFGSVYGTDAI